ncbi:hypothetical protein TYRP_006819 [Tyrophagus putrescentiae]|nr:hypothetical protein TYRP_006819 [Tyrophagus putrescentiae]
MDHQQATGRPAGRPPATETATIGDTAKQETNVVGGGGGGVQEWAKNNANFGGRKAGFVC